MTRRIVIAMVINVWLVLITAGTYTYFVTRSLLVADLDQSIVCRVASLQGIERPPSMPRMTPSADDEFVIKGRDGRIITSLANASTHPAMGDMMPRAINSSFSFLDNGARLRVLTVK